MLNSYLIINLGDWKWKVNGGVFSLDNNEKKGSLENEIQDQLKVIDKAMEELRNKLKNGGEISAGSKVINFLPFTLGRSRPDKTERARTWLGLLVTGIGIVLFWRGIWDMSFYLFSDEISLLFGAIILIVMALIGKRRVFKIFGGE